MASNTQLAQVRAQARDEITRSIVGAKALIVPLLPKHVQFDALMAQMNKHLRENYKLAECTPASVFWAFVHAAEVGLVVGDYFGEGYILGFKNNKQPNAPQRARFIPGYKGLIKLAYQSSLVNRIDAYIIYDRDYFVYDLGREHHRVSYKPYLGMEGPGNLIAVYTQIELSTGAVKDAIMPLWRLEEVRKRSRNGGEGSSPWNTDRPEMYRKTALRHALKDAPKSTEIDRALRLGDAAEEIINGDEDDESEIPGLEDAPQPPQGRASKTRARVSEQAEQASRAQEQKPEALPIGAVQATVVPAQQKAAAGQGAQVQQTQQQVIDMQQQEEDKDF